MTSTDHREFELSLGAYALGALDGEERRALEAHLPGCDRCQGELADLRRMIAGLGLSVDEVEPLAWLRARVLARATGVPPRSAARPDPSVPRPRGGRRESDRTEHPRAPGANAPAWWVAAAAILLAIAIGAYALTLHTELDTLRGTQAAAMARTDTLTEALNAVRRDFMRLTRTVDVLSAPDLMRVDLQGKAAASAASGRAFWSPARGLVFSAEHLPALGTGLAYQLWVIVKPGAPVSAGMLTVGADGATTLVVTLPAGLAKPAAVAVSIEPALGSPAPTTAPILIGAVTG